MTVAISRTLPPYSRIGVTSVHELVRFRVSLQIEDLRECEEGRWSNIILGQPNKKRSSENDGRGGEGEKQRMRGQLLLFPA
jgi:hypothetical protein